MCRLFKVLESRDTKTFTKSALKSIKSEVMLQSIRHEKISSMQLTTSARGAIKHQDYNSTIGSQQMQT